MIKAQAGFKGFRSLRWLFVALMLGLAVSGGPAQAGKLQGLSASTASVAGSPNGEGKPTASGLSKPERVAATFTVNTTTDSGPGSLRQAIIDANATPVTDTIAFNIPGTGPHTIAPASPLPLITTPVVIDGYTQPGSSPNTLADGNNAVLRIELSGATLGAGSGASGLSLQTTNSIIRGLVINRFDSSGISIANSTAGQGNNTIEGNFIGTDPTGEVARANRTGISLFPSSNNTIGGTTPAARNVIAANTSNNIAVSTDLSGNRPTGNRIQGNYIGTDKDGTTALANPNNINNGISFNAADSNVIGGLVPGARNLISGHPDAAIHLQGSNFNLVQGNFIGTDVTGMAALPNNSRPGGGAPVIVIIGQSPFGSTPAAATGNVIGGTQPGAGNVISGNNVGVAAAVHIGSISVGSDLRADGNFVQGNRIGVARDGTTPLANGGEGVRIQGSNNTIGGTAPGAGNTIAFNAGRIPFSPAGVFISNLTGNLVLNNSIHSNNGLGIDLGSNTGLTPNDEGDVDTGPNGLQNFPVLTAASRSGGSTNVTGVLSSTASTLFTLQFFANREADPSCHGEGERFLGQTQVTTNGSGVANFNVSLGASSDGEMIAATATDPQNNTSEFSRVKIVGPSPTMQFSGASYMISEAGPSAVISVTRANALGGAFSLNFATSNGTATASQDYTSTTGVLLFGVGETVKTITVPIKEDTAEEGNETVNLTLSDPSCEAVLGSPSTAVLTIVDNDGDDVCPIEFTDVPTSFVFHPFIKCLVCRGIVSGYSDGTFRPGNSVIRGQVAKMVTNSAGFLDAIPSDRQTFRDVPPTDAFWLFIERAHLHGVISGYDRVEDCGAGRVPCFKPYNNVTRGQMSKIVANAAGFAENHTGQTFQDVASSHPFYIFIERIASRGIISGYTCGPAPAGACVGPNNRPYFLASNDITRGQAAKIVSNTFFPECTPAGRLKR